jgi:hypothetical protein
MKKVSILLLISLFNLMAVDQSTINPDSFYEAQEVLQRAQANPVKQEGIAVRTIMGAQLTPATFPSDMRINQQIYNDSDRLRRKMLDFMVDLTNMGVRYNLSADFELIKQRLEESMTQIENNLRTKLSY